MHVIHGTWIPDDAHDEFIQRGAFYLWVEGSTVGELLARVRAGLRRAQFTKGELTPAMRTPMTVGDLSIDFEPCLVLMAGRKSHAPGQHQPIAAQGRAEWRSKD